MDLCNPISKVHTKITFSTKGIDLVSWIILEMWDTFSFFTADMFCNTSHFHGQNIHNLLKGKHFQCRAEFSSMSWILWSSSLTVLQMEAAVSLTVSKHGVGNL